MSASNMGPEDEEEGAVGSAQRTQRTLAEWLDVSMLVSWAALNELILTPDRTYLFFPKYHTQSGMGDLLKSIGVTTPDDLMAKAGYPLSSVGNGREVAVDETLEAFDNLTYSIHRESSNSYPSIVFYNFILTQARKYLIGTPGWMLAFCVL